MKYGVLFILSLLFYPSFANGTLADKICNAYESKQDKEKCFKEFAVEKEKIKAAATYITFTHGGSACPDKKYWKKLIDNLEVDNFHTEDFDEYCFYIRKNNTVYGILDRFIYKGSELIQVKSSDGKLLWLELAGVKEIASITTKKPHNWSTNLRTQNGKLISNISNNRAKSNNQNSLNSVNYGVRTKGGGIACLSEDWYKEVNSRIDVEFLNYFLKSKKCLILKKDMPITLIDSTIFTRRAIFMFQGVKFWSSMENIIVE